MASGIDDVSAAKTPTMISATQVGQIDQHKFMVEVEWEDNEDRDDETVTIFKFDPPGGSASVHVGAEGSGYTAAGTGRCKGTVMMSAGEFTVTATCSRYVHLTDVMGSPSNVAIGSERSNGVPCTVGKQQGGGKPDKPGQGGGKPDR